MKLIIHYRTRHQRNIVRAYADDNMLFSMVSAPSAKMLTISLDGQDGLEEYHRKNISELLILSHPSSNEYDIITTNE